MTDYKSSFSYFLNFGVGWGLERMFSGEEPWLLLQGMT